MCSKKLIYQLGRPDLNRRPLDPQSRSGRRWVWLSVAPWALDQARQSPGVAGCRLKSVHVGSWIGSFAAGDAGADHCSPAGPYGGLGASGGDLWLWLGRPGRVVSRSGDVGPCWALRWVDTS